MKDSENRGKASYLEKLQRRFKDNPIIAWIIIVFVILSSIGTLISIFGPLVTDWRTDETPKLNITLLPFDPRFYSAGERMNWGGGSQALYVELSESVPNTVYQKDGPQLSDLYNRKTISEVWETFLNPIRINVNAVYDAEKDSPTYIILRWGVEVKPTEIPRNGFFVWYRTGGADGVYSGGRAKIGLSDSQYRIFWLEHDGEVEPPRQFHYLSPGEPVGLQIEIDTITGLYNPNASDRKFMPTVQSAIILRIYAEVLVEGKRSIVRSNNFVRVVFSDQWDELESEIDKFYHEADLIEELRNEAYSGVQNQGG